MTRIIHLSDLHFGTQRLGVVPLLIADIQTLHPDMIVISGDLTQRATPKQYEMAKQFLDAFPHVKKLSVPGNHDISLYNPLERFIYPFSKFKNWISPKLCTSQIIGDIAVLGVNSVTPFKIMSGYITEKQLNVVKEFFQKTQARIKIVVMHHNLIASERHKIINDAEKIINVLAECGVNLVLCGHIHFACVEQVQREFIAHNLYVITAGTAISTRTTAPNSYNIIDIDAEEFTLRVRKLADHMYITENEITYKI
jgi:3',5'-cyclic AMP phosphodiesterase CpdA